MYIQGVSFKGNVKSVNNSKINKTCKLTTTPDTFQKSNYDRKEFSVFLEKIKDENGKPVFNNKSIAKIVNNIEKQPEKYETIKGLATRPNLKGKCLAKIAAAPVENVKIVGILANKKDTENKLKYTSNNLQDFANMKTEDLKHVLPLTDTALKTDDIISLADNKKINFEKLSTKLIDMEKAASPHKLKELSFRKDIYTPEDSYLITANLDDDNIIRTESVDKNLKRLSVDETTYYVSPNNGTYYQITKTNDFRNNTVSKVRSFVDENCYPYVESQVRILKDKNGNVKRTEYMNKSEVKGVYDIKYVYPNGKVEQISSGKKDKKTGIVSVKRDMKSLDGTRTQYLYENDPQGNRIIDYKITDKNGKELLNYSQSFEVIDDNTFISSKNDKVYEIKLDEKNNTLTVKDKATEENNVINLQKLIKGDKKSMINLLKQFPGEELIALNETTDILKGIDNIDDCCYWPDKREIDIVDDLYSVLHELGHSKDNNEGSDMITNRKDVQKVFNEERKLFNDAFPNAQRDYINYFIDIEGHYSGELGGLEETVAESNALLNSYNDEIDIATRSQYLQQYFPRTIAKLATCLHK